VAVGADLAATIRIRVPVTALAVTADGDDAWYVREDTPLGHVGHMPATGGPPFEVDAGPVPVDIAVGADALYLLEGIPDDDPRKGLPRVGVLEKLDRGTLRVVATTKVAGLPVDVLVDGDRVWVGGVDGAVASYDAGTLSPLASTKVSGAGSSVLAAGAGAIWIVNGVVEQHLHLVHRIDPATATELSTWSVPGDGVFGSVAVGGRVWVAAVDEAESLVYPVSLDGAIAPPLRVPRIAALASDHRSLWWLSSGALLNRLDEATLVRSAPVDVGDAGQALAISGDRIWTASDDLVELRAPG
jgi:outer membrane protein assembly factor BamB